MIRILDIQQSIVTANGNVSLAKELFTMLLDDLGARQQQIESSFRSSDMEALIEHIHKLYGATAYCIVPQLRENTSILEDKLKQKDFSQLDKLVKPVLEEIQKVIDAGPELIKLDWQDFLLEE